MHNQTIGVVGTGVMGGGIAQLFAERGFQTLIWDTTPAATTNGERQIRQRIDAGVAKDKLAADEAGAILSRIQPVDDLTELAGAALVIEAVIEDFDAKAGLFARIEKAVSSRTAIGTNTSSLSVSALARTLVHPERFMGIHFFNPPTKLELVEVIGTSALASEVLERVRNILTRCGKTAVNVKDSPGFIVNRLLLPLINEAARLVDAGVASPAEIDTAMRLGALHPAGPLQVADLIGLDVCHQILTTLSRALDQSAYLPAASLRERVEAGHLGRKTGRGFYTY
jgi:3-hydroxybutyryl-CoA dehydrogenase